MIRQTRETEKPEQAASLSGRRNDSSHISCPPSPHVRDVAGDAPVLRLPRWLRVATPVSVVAVAIFHLTYVHLWPRGMFYQIDLQVYRAAGMAVLHGQSLYDHGLIGKLCWVYAPFGALPFVPLALLSLQHSRILWEGVNLVVLVLCVARCWWQLGYRRNSALIAMVVSTAVLASSFEPVRTTILLGQINVVLMALILWDLLRRKRSPWTGIGIGIAAGIKLTPLLFIPYLLATRRFRAAAVAGVTFVATIVLGFLVTPYDARSYWIERKFAATSRISSLDSPVNQSIRGWLARTDSISGTQTLWLMAALAAMALGIGAAVLAWHRGQELLAVAIVGMCSTAVSPFSWDHHWVWYVPLSVYAVHRALASRRARDTAPAAFVYIAGLAWPTCFHAPHNTTNSPSTGLDSLDWAGDGITRNIYVITFLAVSLFTLVALRHAPETASSPVAMDERREPVGAG